MKFPKELRTYCPFCRVHNVHKIKLVGKGKARTVAAGQRSHERTLVGHGGKRAGKVSVKKQGQRQRILLECNKCKKKHERVISGRTKKKLEIQR